MTSRNIFGTVRFPSVTPGALAKAPIGRLCSLPCLSTAYVLSCGLRTSCAPLMKAGPRATSSIPASTLCCHMFRVRDCRVTVSAAGPLPPRQAALREKGPAIVATQVVADFLTPYDGDQQYLKAINKPYAQYTYRMTFRRPPSTTQG